MEGKICAMIRQTWYETAKKNLQPSERVRFYEMCLEFEFFGNEPEEDAPFAARLLFDMVRSDLEGDRKRAAERSERNRQNGMRGGRPKVTEANAEDKNPEEPSGIFRKPIYNNNKQNNTVQDMSDNEDTHMFFSVCLDFFERGCSKPVDEARTFWNYYEALGWKTKSGGDIIDRMALARAWRLQDCSKTAMRNRMAYADLLHKANPVEPCLISDFVSCVRDGASKVVRIEFEERSTCILLDNKYIPKVFKMWMPADENGEPFRLEYKALHNTLD